MRGTIIVLGSQNDARGRLSAMGLSRVSKALEVFFKQPDHKLLLTGHFGWNFNRTKTPHSEYMKRFFLKHGVALTNILPSAKSTNTIEDLLLAKKIIDKHKLKDISLVTSKFHMPRAKLLASKIFGKHYRLQFIPAEDDFSLPLRILYVIHELLRIIQIKLFGLKIPKKMSK